MKKKFSFVVTVTIDTTHETMSMPSTTFVGDYIRGVLIGGGVPIAKVAVQPIGEA